MRTPCPRSQQLRGHRVSVVNDYADPWEIILLRKSNKLTNNLTKTNSKFSKIECLHSQRLHPQNVSVVNDFPDTMSRYSMTTRTLCRHSQLLYGHDVRVVIDYADMVSALSLTTRTRYQRSERLRRHINDWTLFENFEGFSQI